MGHQRRKKLNKGSQKRDKSQLKQTFNVRNERYWARGNHYQSYFAFRSQLNWKDPTTQALWLLIIMASIMEPEPVAAKEAQGGHDTSPSVSQAEPVNDTDDALTVVNNGTQVAASASSHSGDKTLGLTSTQPNLPEIDFNAYAHHKAHEASPSSNHDADFTLQDPIDSSIVGTKHYRRLTQDVKKLDDPQQADTLLEGVHKNDPETMCRIGTMYRNMDFQDAPRKIAKTWLKAALRSGYLNAAFELGLYYEVVEKNYAKAFQYYEDYIHHAQEVPENESDRKRLAFAQAMATIYHIDSEKDSGSYLHTETAVAVKSHLYHALRLNPIDTKTTLAFLNYLAHPSADDTETTKIEKKELFTVLRFSNFPWSYQPNDGETIKNVLLSERSQLQAESLDYTDLNAKVSFYQAVGQALAKVNQPHARETALGILTNLFEWLDDPYAFRALKQQFDLPQEVKLSMAERLKQSGNIEGYLESLPSEHQTLSVTLANELEQRLQDLDFRDNYLVGLFVQRLSTLKNFDFEASLASSSRFSAVFEQAYKANNFYGLWFYYQLSLLGRIHHEALIDPSLAVREGPLSRDEYKLMLQHENQLPEAMKQTPLGHSDEGQRLESSNLIYLDQLKHEMTQGNVLAIKLYAAMLQLNHAHEAAYQWSRIAGDYGDPRALALASTLNFEHGPYADATELIEKIKQASKRDYHPAMLHLCWYYIKSHPQMGLTWSQAKQRALTLLNRVHQLENTQKVYLTGADYAQLASVYFALNDVNYMNLGAKYYELAYKHGEIKAAHEAWMLTKYYQEAENIYQFVQRPRPRPLSSQFGIWDVLEVLLESTGIFIAQNFIFNGTLSGAIYRYFQSWRQQSKYVANIYALVNLANDLKIHHSVAYYQEGYLTWEVPDQTLRYSTKGFNIELPVLEIIRSILRQCEIPDDMISKRGHKFLVKFHVDFDINQIDRQQLQTEIDEAVNAKADAIQAEQARLKQQDEADSYAAHENLLQAVVDLKEAVKDALTQNDKSLISDYRQRLNQLETVRLKEKELERLQKNQKSALTRLNTLEKKFDTIDQGINELETKLNTIKADTESALLDSENQRSLEAYKKTLENWQTDLINIAKELNEFAKWGPIDKIKKIYSHNKFYQNQPIPFQEQKRLAHKRIKPVYTPPNKRKTKIKSTDLSSNGLPPETHPNLTSTVSINNSQVTSPSTSSSPLRFFNTKASPVDPVPALADETLEKKYPLQPDHPKRASKNSPRSKRLDVRARIRDLVAVQLELTRAINPERYNEGARIRDLVAFQLELIRDIHPGQYNKTRPMGEKPRLALLYHLLRIFVALSALAKQNDYVELYQVSGCLSNHLMHQYFTVVDSDVMINFAKSLVDDLNRSLHASNAKLKVFRVDRLKQLKESLPPQGQVSMVKQERLEAIQNYIQILKGFADELEPENYHLLQADPISQYAIYMCVSILGENYARLLEKHPNHGMSDVLCDFLKHCKNDVRNVVKHEMDTEKVKSPVAYVTDEVKSDHIAAILRQVQNDYQSLLDSVQQTFGQEDERSESQLSLT